MNIAQKKKKKNYATISWFEQMSKFTEKNW